MTDNRDDDLILALAELRILFPDWRMGQLIANVAQAAGAVGDSAIWDIQDGDLLKAACRLLERNRVRQTVHA